MEGLLYNSMLIFEYNLITDTELKKKNYKTLEQTDS